VEDQTPWWKPERHADRRPLLLARNRIQAALRGWFAAEGFTEVDPVALQVSPGNEAHLHAFATDALGHDGAARRMYLHTSPEFAMKKLLAAGETRIAAFAHVPEFTMLEWYGPGLTMAQLMDETEALVRAACPPRVAHEGVETDLAQPFERLTMAEAFDRWCGGLDILATEGDGGKLAEAAARIGSPARAGESWEDLFFRLLLECIEPNLGRGRATFLTHWPAPQAALARRDPADPRAALRFELFVAGLELANAFDEQTDPAEQRARFIADTAERRRISGEHGWGVDEDFLAALEHGMPATSGIALGFDRLAMLVAGAREIGDVLWL